MDFAFATAQTIRFGNGVSRELASIIDQGTRKAFVVTGTNPSRHREPIEILSQSGIEVERFAQSGEPSIDSINEGVNAARATQPDIVIGIGGGSAIDSGKAIAAMASNKGELLDYLEVVGRGLPLESPSLPYMAIPTTAGTGAEATRNSVIGVPEAGVKVSLRSPSMLPRWAIVDPELTYQLPAKIAAYTGIDALTQNLEAFLSSKANPLSDAIAREGLIRAGRSLRAACGDSLDCDAKADMCIASLCGGIALANAGLGAVHGFAGPIGGMIDAPHGAICGSLLLPVFRANFDTIKRRDAEGATSRKFDEAARLLTGNPEAKGTYALAWLESLTQDLPLNKLSELGFSSDLIQEASEKALRASSMRGNPVELSKADLREILGDALAIS